MRVSTRELLAEYATLLNKFGTNSAEAEEFIDDHRDNSEFVELADISRKLRDALVPDGCGSSSSSSTLRRP